MILAGTTVFDILFIAVSVGCWGVCRKWRLSIRLPARLGQMRYFRLVLRSQTPADGQYEETKDPNQGKGGGGSISTGGYRVILGS